MKLEVVGLNGWYGPAQILFGVDLNVADNEAVALIGRNGAGKSTTFKALVGLLSRQEGTIKFEGRDVLRSPTHEIVCAGMAYVPEERRIFTDLTVAENLEVGRRPPREGAPTWTPKRLYELFPNLGTMKDRLGGRMSGGEQQMLTIARSLMGNPSLIILDEPSEGLAPKIVEEMAEAIMTLKREGLSILLSEQNLHFAKLISDRVVILERGRVRYAGTTNEIESLPEIRESYFRA